VKALDTAVRTLSLDQLRSQNSGKTIFHYNLSREKSTR